MKRKKITQRDPFGRELSSYEEEQDDGSGPFDSRTGALKDGRSVRVSMMMRDAVSPPSAGALVMYDVPPQRDALVITTSPLPMIVDAFGSVEGLNRPGARYLVAGHRTTDHARLVTLAVMRDDAYKTYDEEAQNAWRVIRPVDPDSSIRPTTTKRQGVVIEVHSANASVQPFREIIRPPRGKPVLGAPDTLDASATGSPYAAVLQRAASAAGITLW